MKIRFKKKVIIIVVVCFMLLIGGSILFLGKDNNSSNKNNKDKEIVSKIDNFDYYLEKGMSEYYEEVYEELEELLDNEEVDYLEYSKVVSKLFLIDVFTLNNKNANNDIGGIQFIYPSFESDFRKIVQTTLYSNIETNFNGERKQELPIVSNVNIVNLEEGTFNYNGVDLSSYNVSIEVSYEKDLGYQRFFSLVLVKEKEKLYVVKLS